MTAIVGIKALPEWNHTTKNSNENKSMFCFPKKIVSIFLYVNIAYIIVHKQKSTFKGYPTIFYFKKINKFE